MDPLVRLSHHVDAQIPQFVIVAIVRWMTCVLCIPLKHAVTNNCPRIGSTLTKLKRIAALSTQILYSMLVTFVLNDAIVNFDLVRQCDSHHAPRPIGIYAGVALVCFVLTTRIDVSASCIVTFICVKNANLLAGVAAVTTLSVFLNLRYTTLLIIFTSGVSTLNATLCISASSATLSVFYSVWVWTAGLKQLTSFVTRNIF